MFKNGTKAIECVYRGTLGERYWQLGKIIFKNVCSIFIVIRENPNGNFGSINL